VVKLVVLTVMFWLFFSPAERPKVDAGSVERQLFQPSDPAHGG